MQLPLAFSPKGTAKGALTWPRPRLVAMASGASIWAPSKISAASLSRILAQDTSRTSSIFNPSRSAKSHSTAAMAMAASTRGMNPIRIVFILCASFSFRPDDVGGNLADASLPIHGGRAQQRIGLRLADRLRCHQDALGAVYDLAIRQRQLGQLELF